MSIWLTLLVFLQLFILLHLLFPLFLLLLKAFRTKHITHAAEEPGMEADYAVIVTAYEQTDLIPAVVDSILNINYSNFIVYVVADNCDISSLKFDNERVFILRPEQILASNIKSHLYAISHFRREHERLTIIDSDNLIDPDYLTELNKVFDLGYNAVQGVRQAKNLNTNYACLDAANDIYYRYVDKKLLTEAGSSSSLSGSGMAFTVSLYQDCLGNMISSGAGFDKILQYEIIIRKYKIAFAGKAIVYDEKTAKSQQLVKQRARWLNTWFKFFKLGIRMFRTGVLNLNLNQFLFGLMLLRPPLFILLFLTLFFFILDVLFIQTLALILSAAAIIFVFVFFSALSYFKADKRIYKSLIDIPKFIFFQVLALLSVRKANKISVATRHEGYKSN